MKERLQLASSIPIFQSSVDIDTVAGSINDNGDVFCRRPYGSISDGLECGPVASRIPAITEIAQAQGIRSRSTSPPSKLRQYANTNAYTTVSG